MYGSSGWLVGVVSFHNRKRGSLTCVYDIIFKLETIKYKNGTLAHFNTAWPHIFLPQIEIACGDTAPMFGTSSSRNCRLPTRSGCGHRDSRSRTPSWFSALITHVQIGEERVFFFRFGHMGEASEFKVSAVFQITWGKLGSAAPSILHQRQVENFAGDANDNSGICSYTNVK